MTEPLLYGEYALLRPLWLLALLPLILALIWRLRAKGARGWGAVVDPGLWPVLVRLGLVEGARHDPGRLLPFLAAAFVVLGLAGPAREKPGSLEYAALDPLILALDLSPSVVADEQALNEARSSAARLAGLSAGRPVGVMLYAADAYLALAPTSDPQGPIELLSALSAETMPLTGSRPDIALAMARDFFDASARGADGNGGADLILISDGGGASDRAAEEATRLKNEGYRIWGLELSRQAEGAPQPAAGAFEKIALSGGGKLAPAMQGEEKLIADIGSARRVRLAARDAGGLIWQDFGPWALLPALLLLLPLFRRRA